MSRKRIKKNPNTTCETCGKIFFKQPCYKKRSVQNFCSKTCQDNFTGGGASLPCKICGKEVYRGQSKIKRNSNFYCSKKCYGLSIKKTEISAKTILTYRSYTNWKKRILFGAECILCGTKEKLELHHIKTRRDFPKLVREKENVVPMCAPCHDIFHSKKSKGGELREHLNAILAHDNPQPSRSNVIRLVDRKVQRLTGEDITTNKPDTSAAPERDEIVRAYLKR